MNKFKKIGVTALAGSLMAVTANAGEMSVAGTAKIALEHINGGAASSGKSWSMGNQLTFSGSGDLDNGMNVSLSFVIDQGDDTTATAAGLANSPFDSHSVSVGMDGLGTLTFHGEGGDSAVGAMDGSAAGGMWDNFQAAADEPESGHSSNDMLSYALPTFLDDLALVASYTPNGDGGANSSTSFSATYTGVDGLTIAYGQGEDNKTTATADATAWKVSYTYGPITATATDLEYSHETATSSRDMSSIAVSYLLPGDQISIGYGEEEITDGTASSEKAEFSGFDVSYTAGGMTLKAYAQEAENISYSTTETEDQEVWAVNATFAF
ncbi:porin [Candidatus Pelagibacter sp.]|nr:porin [Candidatus Pelagibacter sp.]